MSADKPLNTPRGYIANNGYSLVVKDTAAEAMRESSVYWPFWTGADVQIALTGYTNIVWLLRAYGLQALEYAQKQCVDNTGKAEYGVRLHRVREALRIADGGKVIPPPMILRVWHIPQIPGKPFHTRVENIEEAMLLIQTLQRYDSFQYENNIKPDYAAVSGLEEYMGKQEGTDNEWCEWCGEETGLDIHDTLKALIND